MNTQLRFLVVVLALAIFKIQTPCGYAQGTAFTYQGRLNDGPAQANGNFDLRFALYNAASAGAAQGNALTNVATAVSNGLFTVSLDFGNQFPGADRWLEIAVRTNGGSAFSTLTPRQQLTATPYAVQAASASTATTATTATTANSVAAANVTGTFTASQLPANLITNNQTGVTLGGTFNGSGAGLTNLNAANLTGGTVPLPLLPGAVVTNGESGVNISGTFSGNGIGITNVDVRNLQVVSANYPRAWGSSFNGETNVPPGLSNVLAVCAGRYHSLLLKDNGTVLAWGLGTNALPGGGTAQDTWGQAIVPAGLSNVVALGAGIYHSFAVKQDGSLVGWGNNSLGQVTVPAGLSNVVAASGGLDFSVALKSDGTVVAWGVNSGGQTNVPAGLSNVVAIDGGYAHTLALKSDGTVVAWGWNPYGQTNVPPGLNDVVAIAAGEMHSLALKRDGTVVAWGAGTNNSGTFPNYGQSLVPTNLSNVVAISAGLNHSLALKSDGTLVAWGRTNELQTVIPADMTNVTTIACGGNFNLAILQQNQSAPVALLNRNNTFTGSITASGFTGNGSGLTSLNAANLTGTIASNNIAAGTIGSAQIVDGTIVDADISPSAAIADTKLATLSTAGKVADSALSANVALLSANPQTFSGINNFATTVKVGTRALADGQLVNFRVVGNDGAFWKGGGAFGHSNATVILGELSGYATLGGHNANLGAWANLIINPVAGFNVGIGTTNPVTTLDVNGSATTRGFNIVSVTTNAPTAAVTLTAASGYVVLNPASAVTLSGTTAITAGTTPGQMLVLRGNSDVNTVTINDNASTALGANRVLGLNDILSLVWTGSVWAEISYANN